MSAGFIQRVQRIARRDNPSDYEIEQEENLPEKNETGSAEKLGAMKVQSLGRGLKADGRKKFLAQAAPARGNVAAGDAAAKLVHFLADPGGDFPAVAPEQAAPQDKNDVAQNSQKPE
jgi:hypothetical protein